MEATASGRQRSSPILPIEVADELKLAAETLKYVANKVFLLPWVFFDNRVLSFFGIYEIIFRNDRINDSHSGVALVSKCGANLSVEALSLQSKYDFCACVMVHLPDNVLFLFIVFIYHPIVVTIKIGPSTLNFCLSYCYLKSQLNNAELHVVYWVTLI